MKCANWKARKSTSFSRNMKTYVVLATLLCLSTIQQCHTIEGRYSLLRNGDFMLQGLFPLTTKDGEKCETVYSDGLMWSLAMAYAVEMINNSSFVPNTTLGYKIDNTCFNIPEAMRYAIEIVAEHRPNSVCYPHEQYCENNNERKRTHQISAVIGPAVSWISIPLASLLGLYSIPQISYGSTSRILSDKTRYKSFLRTVPSDEYQARAMAEFVRHFRWNYVFLIASDDDYGKMGAAAFKTAARNLNVCIANDEYISFNSERATDYVQSTLNNVKKLPRAKVIIVFSYLWQGEMLLKEAHKLNITDRTWVTSDGWNSAAENMNVEKSMLQGVFTFAILSKPVPKFEEYVKNIRVVDALPNPWLLAFIEDTLKCRRPDNNITGPSKQPGSYRVCGLNEKLPPGLRILSELISNVIDAVNATANALRRIIDCPRLGNLNCPNASLPIPPEVMLAFISNVSFVGADDVPVKFNQNGDRTSSGYVIRNLQISQENKPAYRDIGYWALLDKKPEFHINSSLIQWNQGARPLSTCFRICQAGEKVVGQSECCWNCQKCEKGTVSSVAGSYSCEKCNETHYDNEQRTQCIQREIIYLDLSGAAGISIFTFSIIGILASTGIAGVFWKLRLTPIIASSGNFLLVLLFVNLYFSFLFGTSFLFGKPSRGNCLTSESLHELLAMLYSAFFVAKTRAANKALKSAVPAIKNMRIGSVSEMIIVGVLIVLEVVLIIIRQADSPSATHFRNLEDNTRLLECEQDFPASRITAISTPMILLLLATFLAFKERNNANAFNEPKFISFTTIALCILLVAFIPTYRYVIGISRILVVALAAFTTAFSCMGCIFIPKLYVIFMRPERNTMANPNAGEREVDISPHTTSSEGHSPDLRAYTGGKSITPKEYNAVGIKKDRNVNFCVNEGLDESGHVTATADHVSPHDVYIKSHKKPRKISAIQMNFELSTVMESNEEATVPNSAEGKTKPVKSKSMQAESEEASSSNPGYTDDLDEAEGPAKDGGKNNETDLTLRPPRAFTVI